MSARRDIAMSTAEVLEFLEQGRHLQVATIGKDGWPHLTTLWYVVVDERVVFRCFSKSQRLVNLTRNPRLTVLVEEGDSYESLRGVMIQGTAVLDNDPTAVLDAYYRVTAKYQNREVAREAVEQMFGRFVSKNTVVTVDPHNVISWDHTKLSGGY